MSSNIKSLWSPKIRGTAFSPLTILKGQAEALGPQTGGVLIAEVIEERNKDGKISLSMDLVVPALNGSRHRILKVNYQEGSPYPAWVEAETFRYEYATSRKRTNSDQEFTETVAVVLRSDEVLSLAQSLVARATEALSANGSSQ